MGQMKVDIHSAMEKARTNGFFDDFNNYTDAALWTKGVTGTTPTVTNPDYDGGGLLLTTDATKNNEAFVFTTRKLFTFQANKAIMVQCELNYTDADTNNLACAFGLFSGTIAAMLADDTYVPISSFSGALLYKRAAETLWRGFSSIGSTQYDNLSVSSTQNPAKNQRLMILCQPVGSNIEFSYFTGVYGIGGGNAYAGQLTPGINQLQLNDGSGLPKRALQIKHTIPYASAAAMKLGFFAKAGSSVSQLPVIDYIGWEYLARP